MNGKPEGADPVQIPIPLKIDAEGLNKALLDALTASMFGQQLEKELQAKVTEVCRYIDNPIRRIVEQHVNSIIIEVVQAQLTETIKERVRTIITDQMIYDMVQRGLEKLMRNY